MKKAYYMAGLIAFVSVCIVNPTYAGSGGGSFNPHGTHVAPSTASQMQEVHMLTLQASSTKCSTRP